jgi:hypothetical protein
VVPTMTAVVPVPVPVPVLGVVLTSEQVERQLEAAKAAPSPGLGQGTGSKSPSAPPGSRIPTPTATPPPTATPTATAAAGRKTFSTRGGTAIAVCEGATVRLLSWAPAQGYGVESADPGPDDEHAEVKFEGTAGKVELRVRCANGIPTGSWKQDD